MTAVAESVLRCPDCRTQLRSTDQELVCASCGWSHTPSAGIPVLLPTTLTAHKLEQLDFFDGTDPEFEIARPHGLPRFHAWFLHEKLRRAVAGVSLAGARVLVVCGGSGMDAELLARAGARVITSDLSPGAALRAQERSRRYGIGFDVMVADVERLPFPDREMDVAYVHDGLHHLDDPLAGVREMARVARTAVCISEPADAFLTSLATRVGLAQDHEDAGNRVARLRLEDIRRTLEESGFKVMTARRYAMLYRHVPGRAMRLLSRPAAFPLAIGVYRVANAAFGRFGNKLSVTAVRS
jgi:SAM-dependent methyltransferase